MSLWCVWNKSKYHTYFDFTLFQLGGLEHVWTGHGGRGHQTRPGLSRYADGGYDSSNRQKKPFKQRTTFFQKAKAKAAKKN